MKINEKLLEKVADLAKLKLSENEKMEFSKQLSDIINYVEKIEKLETDTVEPANHIVALNNIFREDLSEESMNVSELEKMAPQFTNGHIVVPRIIDDNE